MTPAPHVSRNTMMWSADKNVEAARKHAGWAQFHRECGKHGLYFDDIEPCGRSRYQALTFRLMGNVSFRVSRGEGKTVIAACLDALKAAEVAGFPITGDPGRLFADAPGPADIMALLDSTDLEELLG